MVIHFIRSEAGRNEGSLRSAWILKYSIEFVTSSSSVADLQPILIKRYKHYLKKVYELDFIQSHGITNRVS